MIWFIIPQKNKELKLCEIILKKTYFVACEFNGKVYKSGEKFRKGDGCNECVCMPGGIAQCTNKPCYPGKLWPKYHILFFKCWKLISY